VQGAPGVIFQRPRLLNLCVVSALLPQDHECLATDITYFMPKLVVPASDSAARGAIKRLALPRAASLGRCLSMREGLQVDYRTLCPHPLARLM